jgi:hypothetical protein
MLEAEAPTQSIVDLDDDALAERLGIGGETSDDGFDDGEEHGAPAASGDEGAESDEELETPTGDESTATDGKETDEDGEEEADPAAPPAAAADPAPAKEPRALAAQFTVTDAEGEIEPADVADLTVKFTAQGKERVLTFDKVVRLAASGLHNEELQVAADRAGDLVRELETTKGNAQQFERDVLAKIAEILENPEQYDALREKHLAQNTPEERLKRSEQRTQRLEWERQEQARAASGEQFATTKLYPAIEALRAQCPNVSDEEVEARLTRIFTPLLDRSQRIPVESFDRALQLVQNDLGPWMETREASRVGALTTVKKAAATDAATKITKAKEAVTLAKRRFVRPLKAKAGTAGKPASAAGARDAKPPKNADEANDRIIAKLFA